MLVKKGSPRTERTGSLTALISCAFTESRYEHVLLFYMKAITDRPTVRPSDIFPSRFQSRRCIEVVNQSIYLSEGSSVTKLKSMAASVLSSPIHFFTCSQHDVVNRSCLGRCVCNRNASVGIVINLQLRDFDVFRLRRPKMPLNVARPCF